MNLYNTTFETSLRVLILLCKIGKEVSEDMILWLDFICLYGKDFGVTDYNLHGENKFKFGEIAARRKKVKDSLKKLVLDGNIEVRYTISGFVYQRKIDNISLTSEYADEYAFAVESAIKKLNPLSDKELRDMVMSKARERKV